MLKSEQSQSLPEDLAIDWSSPDGLMTALIGELPSISGLEISVKNELLPTYSRGNKRIGHQKSPLYIS